VLFLLVAAASQKAALAVFVDYLAALQQPACGLPRAACESHQLGYFGYLLLVAEAAATGFAL
jgi:hypothetical protein